MANYSALMQIFCVSTIICLAIAGCASSDDVTSSTSDTIQNMTTPTPTVLALAPDMEETEPPPESYSIEIQMPYELDQSTVIAEPGEGNVCLTILPLQLTLEGDRKMSHGSADILCNYTILPGPLPYTVHLINQFEASFDGEVFPSSESYPEGWIDGYLNVTGTTTQYYVDFTMEVPNLCPESSPCTVPGDVVFNLPFHLVDGDRIQQEWIFILYIN